jgi:hypothetical protein
VSHDIFEEGALLDTDTINKKGGIVLIHTSLIRAPS